MEPETNANRFQYSLRTLLAGMAVLAFVVAGARDGNAVGLFNAAVFSSGLVLLGGSQIVPRHSIVCTLLMCCGAYLLAVSALVGLGQIAGH